MTKVWNYCPACHEVTEENGDNSFLGNVPFHEKCVESVLERARATNTEVHLVFENHICVGVELLQRQNHATAV